MKMQGTLGITDFETSNHEMLELAGRGGGKENFEILWRDNIFESTEKDLFIYPLQ